MIAGPIPDEVVERAARHIVNLCDVWNGGEGGHPDDCDDEAWELARGVIRSMAEDVRLVQLPEEPTATVWTEDGGDIVDVEIGTDLVEGENHLYRIPGQPITVDKEERDGNA